jgi:hypothetical protein
MDCLNAIPWNYGRSNRMLIRHTPRMRSIQYAATYRF